LVGVAQDLVAVVMMASGCGAPRTAWAVAVEAGGRIRWRTPLATRGNTITVNLPAIADGPTAYFAQDDTVYAIATDTGRPSWQWTRGSSVSGMWLWQGTLVVLVDQTGPHPLLAGLNTADGAVRWSAPMPGVLGVPTPTVDGGLALLHTDQTLEVVDLADGHRRWSTGGVTAPSVGAVDGLVVAGQAGTLSGFDDRTGRRAWRAAGLPAVPIVRVAAGVVLVTSAMQGGSNSTALTAVNPATGRTLWRLDQGGPLTVLTAAAQGILVASYTPRRALFLLDPVTGKPRWQVDTAIYIGTTPALLAQDVISIEGGVHGYPNVQLVDRTTRSGTVRWQVDLGTRPAGAQKVITVGPHAIVQTVGNQVGTQAPLLAYDLTTGTAAWQTAMPTFVQVPPTVDGTLLLVQPADPPTAHAVTG
jgi:outer membrane protein assembly factor BamB